MSSLRFCTEIHVAVERENIQVPGGVVCGNTRAHFATLWCGNTQRITAQCWCIEVGNFQYARLDVKAKLNADNGPEPPETMLNGYKRFYTV